jgi:chromosome segregation protein
MDKGAHFYRADFQVHSPRDLNWKGSRPTTESDRLEFARRFVRECRQKGIQAVAITDHHDICFTRYYQFAAQEDKEPSFTPKPDLQSPIIFPGVELTLSLPCQTLVLLDADADSELQKTLLTMCGIRPHPENAPTGPQIESLPFDNLKELEERLNESPVLRGRFIVIPNVSCKSGVGYKSLLREQGFNSKYASMPCIGGYIECDWEEQIKKNILEGEVKEWGYKALGVFQTSDSRREDLSDLGQRSSWVKMAIPKAESLRQACLARKSRIHQVQPQLPTIHIRRIWVTDSVFLGPIDLELNNQFNAIIGGRGTGKTSLLEYIRYAMQDQPPEGLEDESVHDEIAEKRERIIETLKARNGTVTIEWLKNRVPHIVSFGSSAMKPTLKVGDDPPIEITSEELRTILPVQAYSQKQLSTVGVREKELRRFIEQPIQAEIKRCNERIAENRYELSQKYDRLSELNDKNRKLASLRIQLRSIKEQVNVVESSLPKLSEELQKALKEHPLRLQEKKSIDDMEADYDSARMAVKTAIKTLSDLPRALTLLKSCIFMGIVSRDKRRECFV